MMEINSYSVQPCFLVEGLIPARYTPLIDAFLAAYGIVDPWRRKDAPEWELSVVLEGEQLAHFEHWFREKYEVLTRTEESENPNFLVMLDRDKLRPNYRRNLAQYNATERDLRAAEVVDKHWVKPVAGNGQPITPPEVAAMLLNMAEKAGQEGGDAKNCRAIAREILDIYLESDDDVVTERRNDFDRQGDLAVP